MPDGDWRQFTPLEELLCSGPYTPLKTRLWNCLKYSDIKTIDELMHKSDRDLRRIKNMGKKSIKELRDVLAKLPPELAHGPMFHS